VVVSEPSVGESEIIERNCTRTPKAHHGPEAVMNNAEAPSQRIAAAAAPLAPIARENPFQNAKIKLD